MIAVVSRAEVVACAREWMGTPFQHQQRSKGVAVDCAGLIIGVARELGLVDSEFDVNAYPRQADGVSLIASCDRYLLRTTKADLLPADVIAVSFDGRPQHLGFVADYRHGGLSMIHAYDRPTVRKVVEHRLLFGQSMKFAGAFRFKGVA